VGVDVAELAKALQRVDAVARRRGARELVRWGRVVDDHVPLDAAVCEDHGIGQRGVEHEGLSFVGEGGRSGQVVGARNGRVVERAQRREQLARDHVTVLDRDVRCPVREGGQQPVRAGLEQHLRAALGRPRERDDLLLALEGVVHELADVDFAAVGRVAVEVVVALRLEAAGGHAGALLADAGLACLGEHIGAGLAAEPAVGVVGGRVDLTAVGELAVAVRTIVERVAVEGTELAVVVADAARNTGQLAAARVVARRRDVRVARGGVGVDRRVAVGGLVVGAVAAAVRGQSVLDAVMVLGAVAVGFALVELAAARGAQRQGEQEGGAQGQCASWSAVSVR